jgi:6-pyruvoyl-tetrahydropterin synthase
VTVEGEIDPETGYVLDLKILRDLVEERVVRELDHRNLNLDVEWLEGTNPTTENLVVAIWRRLEGRLPGSCGSRTAGAVGDAPELRGVQRRLRNMVTGGVERAADAEQALLGAVETRELVRELLDDWARTRAVKDFCARRTAWRIA